MIKQQQPSAYVTGHMKAIGWDLELAIVNSTNIHCWNWEGNRQEGQGSPNGGNSLQVSDIFISLKRQEETN